MPAGLLISGQKQRGVLHESLTELTLGWFEVVVRAVGASRLGLGKACDLMPLGSVISRADQFPEVPSIPSALLTIRIRIGLQCYPAFQFVFTSADDSPSPESVRIL